MTGSFPILSSRDKEHAKDALSILLIEGSISESDLIAKSKEVDVASFVNDLEETFQDLPGGVPFIKDSDGALVPVGSRVKYMSIANAEHPEIFKRAALAKNLEIGVLVLTTILFAVLFFIIKLPFSWLIWVTVPFTILLPRMILGVSDPQRKAYEVWRDKNLDDLKVNSN